MGRSCDEATKACWSLRLRAMLLALRGLRWVLTWRTRAFVALLSCHARSSAMRRMMSRGDAGRRLFAAQAAPAGRPADGKQQCPGQKGS